MKERLKGLIILTSILLIGLFFPFKIPFEIVSLGSVYPAKEWRLVQDSGGNVMSTLQDYEKGVVDKTRIFKTIIEF